MRKVLYVMAIKPAYARAIYEGAKTWEFRKAPPPIHKPILLYESAPVSAITGGVVFEAAVTGAPDLVLALIRRNKIWERSRPGVTLSQLEAYAGGGPVTALRVGFAERIAHPPRLDGRPPQNWGRYTVTEKGGEA